MADRSSRNAPAPNPIGKIVPIVCIVIGAALSAYAFIPRSGDAPAPTTAVPAGTPGTVGQPTAPAPAEPAPELTKQQLIKEAGTAFREQRYVAPRGNNALEYYLRVLDKEPNNLIASDALREMFPFATGAVEQDISRGNLDEATRVIDLLAKTAPGNSTLAILRGKLNAKNEQVDNELKRVAAAAAAAANARTAATTPAETTTAATTRASSPATATTANTHVPPPVTTAAATPPPTTAASTAAPPPATAPTAPEPPPATATKAAAPAASANSRSAELVKSVSPDYPREAYVKHQEGSVDLEFTVTTDGKVTDAVVVSSQPARVFDDAALKAVQRYRFNPKLDNGKAVEERMKRHLEFKLRAG
jgi:periplasmic protein TonB